MFLKSVFKNIYSFIILKLISILNVTSEHVFVPPSQKAKSFVISETAF